MSPALVRLVRHGRAAAGWDQDPDPDLDDVGHHQATRVAAALAALQPVQLISSPLLRCRSTAQHVADATGLAVHVDPAVAEVPSPEDVSLADRGEWLRTAMQGTWADLGPWLVAYRDDLLSAVRSRPSGTVIVSHFVAINAVIGACRGSDALLDRRLDHCSITTVSVDEGQLTLVEGGREADTVVR